MINFSTILKKILIIFFFLILILILWISFNFFKPIEKIKIKYSVSDPVQILKIDGKSFRDLNKNNKLDIYEDYRLDSIIRSEDLLDQMNLEEKIGQMFHPPFTLNPDIWMLIYEMAIRGSKLTETQILFNNISHFNLYGNPSPLELAVRINYLQEIASKTRLGIPVTISSDPIHEVPKGGGVASFSVDGFSKWPSQLGFAATKNPNIVKEFGEIAKEEYLAVGIRTALHPMSDLATDPRWARNFGTFGSDAILSKIAGKNCCIIPITSIEYLCANLSNSTSMTFDASISSLCDSCIIKIDIKIIPKRKKVEIKTPNMIDKNINTPRGISLN